MKCKMTPLPPMLCFNIKKKFKHKNFQHKIFQHKIFQHKNCCVEKIFKHEIVVLNKIFSFENFFLLDTSSSPCDLESRQNARPNNMVARWLRGWVAGWLGSWLGGWVAGWLDGYSPTCLLPADRNRPGALYTRACIKSTHHLCLPRLNGVLIAPVGPPSIFEVVGQIGT